MFGLFKRSKPQIEVARKLNIKSTVVPDNQPPFSEWNRDAKGNPIVGRMYTTHQPPVGITIGQESYEKVVHFHKESVLKKAQDKFKEDSNYIQDSRPHVEVNYNGTPLIDMGHL